MLEAIGLGRQDEEVYDALVRRTQATAAEIVADCHLPPPAARRALQSLVGLGLATRSTGRPVRYVAVPPDSGLEAILRERERELGDVRTHIRALMDVYRAGTRFAHPGELIEVVSGREEVNHRWVRMQQDTRVQMRGFDRPPYAAPQEHTEPNPVELQLLRQGVKYRVIYDVSVLELPGWLDDVTAGLQHGEQARIAAVPMKLGISDDRLAIIPLLRAGDSVVSASYLIHPSPLLDALVALFEALWERSRPVRLTGGEPERDLSQEEERLLTLLAAGATDKAASRALGWSERTVQRHLGKLMRRLGAQTRFQVAMEATRRGWI
ncbi:helix-turn-helix transcriptional regulator [Nonomuraea gerenzanensis]|uniref:Transcriptional regulator, TrmB family / Transcriptional regulator, LuxR family n=1 Tax=Nonomuraea gerenzanensis TaxID=93944 RepID=A0A1M4E8Z0_9ACTN|nr:helix-turn-helix domain-containing protein [Nonomuraea gerenzanensis]UBU17488.1 LuxR C-terminal-related transcriptional regulator [Nonomuraea gerenzanensis]SBO95244.1 Transcriptional regulator, TrmB family / Transcriptional regulator, LuxR family [Nonomuraea gerenzanensis]